MLGILKLDITVTSGASFIAILDPLFIINAWKLIEEARPKRRSYKVKNMQFSNCL